MDIIGIISAELDVKKPQVEAAVEPVQMAETAVMAFASSHTGHVMNNNHQSNRGKINGKTINNLARKGFSNGI